MTEMTTDSKTALDVFTFSVGQHDITYVRAVQTEAGVFRVTIRRNFYEMQSLGVAERHDGTRWHEVVTWPGSEFFDETPSPYSHASSSAKREALEEIADALLDVAMSIVMAARAVSTRSPG